MSKNENEIWSDFLGFIRQALSLQGITGWTVTRSIQPTQGKLPPPYVIVNQIGEQAIGWQGKITRRLSNNKLEQLESQLTEYTFQVDAVKKRTGDANEITSADILRKLRMWFMSEAGIQTLRNAGYSIFRISEVRVVEFETETDVYELYPNMDIKIVYQQEFGNTLSEITKATGTALSV